MEPLAQPLSEYLTTGEFTTLAARIGIQLLRVLIIFAAAAIGTKIVSRLIVGLRQRIVKVMEEHAGGPSLELEKRAATVGGILRKTTMVVVWLIAAVMALKEVGFDVGPILAGAGVIGLAVGFGAQNLVRDVIAGLFILLENQIRVNDVAIINGTGGLVEEINLRTTVLRSLDGVVHVFPNGSINTLSNVTREFSFYVFEIGVAYKEDTDRVVEALRQVGEELRQDETCGPQMLDAVEIFGVDQFADSAVVIKGRIKTKPVQQWMVGREFNRRVKKKFDQEGIEIPFPHRSIYFGEASRPFQLGVGEQHREEIKQVVREVLAEFQSEGERKAAGGPLPSAES